MRDDPYIENTMRYGMEHPFDMHTCAMCGRKTYLIDIMYFINGEAICTFCVDDYITQQDHETLLEYVLQNLEDYISFNYDVYQTMTKTQTIQSILNANTSTLLKFIKSDPDNFMDWLSDYKENR